MSDALALGNTIRKIRQTKDLSLEALARRCNIGYLTLQRIERGKQLNPRLQTLRAIARELGIPITDLFVEETAHAHTTDEAEARDQI